MADLDITAHAEALAKRRFSPPDEIDMNAIAEAMTTVFDAGALAMREAAANVDFAVDLPLALGLADGAEKGINAYYSAIRAIDPASLREVGHG